MRILVTGGAGFIGSHVADGFIREGHEVAILDDLSTGNLANVNARAHFYQVDLRDSDIVQAVFREFRPEVVDHHAAQSEVPRSIADPMFDASVNILGGLSLLRAALDTGVRKIIFISTGGALYGEPDVVPCSEEHEVRPLSPYGTSKYCFEQYLGTFRRTFGLDFTVLRYANIYGPRQDFAAEEGRVVAIFASRMLAGRPVTIDGTGDQARDFLYVSDAVAANIAALEAGSGEAFHISTGEAVTVNQIYSEIARATQYRRTPDHGPQRKGDVFRIALDPSKANRDLHWRATTSLAIGLSQTVAYFRGAIAATGE